MIVPRLIGPKEPAIGIPLATQEYFFRSSSTIYNKPPKYETEEPSMEYQQPIGLQVIESLLHDTRIDHKALLEQAVAVESTAADLPALLYDFTASDRQLLESLRGSQWLSPG